ncbi:HK97 family phage prohead protease [Bosea vaviloviae]|uniref:HK97 family phage prohead protease n=1 Tax=Bosea vaviloviae TaxID=1526658 RepID=UPI0006BAC0C3|nr:HK97 family phage prohead protease [Bosea vaviloviae]
MRRPFPAGPFACEAKFLALPPARIRPDGLFEGYASLFGIADLGKDVVERGAFRDSLTRRGPAGVKLLWQHDPAEPIGRWIALTEDSRGLFVRGQLSLAVARAREIHALMREGAIDGLSIGFRSEKARTEPRSGLRRLERIDLWEISIVTFPMLPQARVSAVKALRAAQAVTQAAFTHADFA